jgi:hypothetical protein
MIQSLMGQVCESEQSSTRRPPNRKRPPGDAHSAFSSYSGLMVATVYGCCDFSDREIVAAGGWKEAYSHVLAKASLSGDRIVVLVDTNYDNEDGYVYVDLYQVTEAGTLRGLGGTNAGGGGSGWLGGITFAYGKATADSLGTVRVEFDTEQYEVPIQRGWWLFAVDRPKVDYAEEPHLALSQ